MSAEPNPLGLTWCPTCAVETIAIRDKCGWCDTATVPLRPAQTPKPRRRRRNAPISDSDLRTLHALHMQGDRLSALELARRTYEKYGYKNAASCHRTILDGWKVLGLKARDRIEMTVAMSRTNGLSPRDWKERRALRLAAGLTCKGKERKPACLGTNARGERCTRGSMPSGYCYSHDPAREAERAANCAAMRARSPLFNQDYEPFEPIRQELQRTHASGVAWAQIAATLGVSAPTIKTYATPGRVARVSTKRAQRYRAALASIAREEAAAA